ncbi:MAG: tRNA (guanosine(46)-N7)-methyltransferase TrmB [Clostridiales bacterium]|nr:tRNA (guanosine(46)-N7)-methyltransferase TrmB [Clostridiales bacterium]
MHMRRKTWARPELESCPYYRELPESCKGKWAQEFPHAAPLHIELGCGKGVSTAQMVRANPHINYLVIDLVRDVLGSTRRNIEAAFQGDAIENVIISALHIEYIYKYIGSGDQAERIYINFCNPWTKRKKHEKRRLTHSRQLMLYRDFLTDGGEIWFKTDDDILFDDSLEYFRECGFEVRYLTRDLHASGFTPNYMSEHEIMYTEKGVPIKFAIAVKGPLPENAPKIGPEDDPEE